MRVVVWSRINRVVLGALEDLNPLLLWKKLCKCFVEVSNDSHDVVYLDLLTEFEAGANESPLKTRLLVALQSGRYKRAAKFLAVWPTAEFDRYAWPWIKLRAGDSE